MYLKNKLTRNTDENNTLTKLAGEENVTLKLLCNNPIQLLLENRNWKSEAKKLYCGNFGTHCIFLSLL